jgi:serine/threonine protein kinase
MGQRLCGCFVPPTPKQLRLNDVQEESASSIESYDDAIVTFFASELKVSPPEKATEKVVKTDNVRLVRRSDGLYAVNQYLIMETLGRGSFGKVKKVFDTIERQFFVDIDLKLLLIFFKAMKVINKPFLKKKKVFIRGKICNEFDKVEREIQIMSSLRHPNVVQLHEVIDNDEHSYLYMSIVWNFSSSYPISFGFCLKRMLYALLTKQAIGIISNSEILSGFNSWA